MSKNFAKGILFGSIVGGLGGLFMAPRSGNDTRKKLAEELDEATELTLNLDASLKRFQSSLVQLKETADELIDPFVTGTQQDIEDFKFQAEPRIAQIQEQLEKIQHEVPAEWLEQESNK